MNPGQTQKEKQSTFEFIGRAFRYRNYRFFFGGQYISLIGTWMQQMSWLVYRLTDSAFYLGLIGFTGQAPIFFLTSFAGVFVDRIHRRNLLIITQTLATIQASLLAFLTISGHIQVWHLALLSLFHGLKEGYRYALGFPPIKYVLLLLALTSLVGMPYMVLMPIFARDILHGGPHTLGFLMGASGVGGLVGALYLASRKSVLDLGKFIVIASSTFGTGLIVFSFSRSFPLSLFILLLAGFGMILQMASSNTVIQTVVDEDKRGRIMSLYAMAWGGTALFGSMMAGSLASRIGAPNTLIISGIICIIGSLLFLKKLPLIRQAVTPIYIRMGIIREMPVDVQ